MHMTLKSSHLFEKAQPGQFIMFQAAHPPLPLLRRPFGIHNIWTESNKSESCGITLLYQVVGKGTKIMAGLNAGSKVDVIGPLGKGFSKCNTEKAVLVAGGVGVAPLSYLADKLVSAGQKVVLLTGARTKDLLYTENFPDSVDVIVATDDGSEGIRGPVTAALEALLDEDSRETTIYAAGPKGMLQRIADLAALYEANCELSLEAFMACGIGACYGCTIKAIGQDGEPAYLRVCKDGPVFNSRKIISFKGEPG